MTKKWKYFVGAVLLGGYVLLACGAPPFTVALGIGLAAVMTGRTSHQF